MPDVGLNRIRSGYRLSGATCVGLLMLGTALEVKAQSSWVGGTSNDWFVASNWSPVGVPGAGENVIINTQMPNSTLLGLAPTPVLGAIQIGETAGAELEILNGGELFNDGIAILGTDAGSSGSVFVDGAGSSWTINNNLVVGQSGLGILNILDGATLSSNNSRIGNETAGNGGVTVQGSGWTINGNLWVGHTGSGVMDVRDGSLVTSSAQSFIGYDIGASGSMRVRGGSGWSAGGFDSLVVGRQGVGSLSIESGSVVDVSGIALGVLGAGSGSVSLEGGSLTIAPGGGLDVGLNGQGQIEILAGGSLTSGLSRLGGFPTGSGSVTVSGPTAAWSSTSSVAVGFQGSGGLLIEAGGSVNNSGAGLGSEASSLGEVLVTGTGSSWILDSSLLVGNQGAGLLEVTDGGQVTSQISQIGVAPAASGTVVLTDPGSNWSVSGPLSVGHEGSGTLEIGAGALLNASGSIVVASQPGSSGLIRLDGGTVNVVTGLVVNSPGALRGPGTINGPVQIGDGGTLQPGLGFGSPGTLDINGNLGLTSDARLEFQLDTPGVVGGGVNSLIEVDGDLTLNGVLNIDDEGSFGDGVYTLFTYTGTLTDSGLVLNDVPPGFPLAIDTSVAGEVRLLVGATGPFTWIGSVSDDWFTAGNWSPAAVPGAGDVVNLDNVVPNPTVIDGLLNANSADLNVGAAMQGELIIRNEAILSSTASSIAGFVGSTGSALVTFPGSRWDMSVILTVGASGVGTLRVEDGGVVTSPTSFVGTNTGSVGEATVRGDDSQWLMSGELLVGRFGSGNVRIEDGALLESENASIGFRPGSAGEVTVDGAGSRWNNDDELVVGGEGNSAILNITSGGLVNNRGNMAIGLEPGFGGQVVLEEAGSELRNAGSLFVALEGEGLLDIGMDTEVAVGGSTTIAEAPGSIGELRVNGTLISDFGVTVQDGGTLGGDGSVVASVQSIGGQLTPGASPGTLDISGFLELDNASLLTFELDAPGVVGGGVNDLIAVDGDLILDGTLEIVDLGGFAAGSYTLITYTGDLNDNGLDIAGLPAGFSGLIDVTTAGEVRLIVSATAAPELMIVPAVLDFGDVEITTGSAPLVATLSNTGAADLVVDSVSLPVAPFAPDESATTCTELPFTLTPGASCDLAAVFTPSTVGSFSQPLLIGSNAPGSPASLELIGNGIELTPPVPSDLLAVPTLNRFALLLLIALLLPIGMFAVASRYPGGAASP